MAFNTTSFFAGVGTMFAAVAIGFAGGALITSSPKTELNRVERIAASMPAATPTVKTESVEAAPLPDRVIPVTPGQAGQQPAAQQQALAQPAPTPSSPAVTVSDDAASQASQIESAKKVREAELKKETEFRKAERREARRIRRKRQEIESAASAVRQLRRDGAIQQVSQSSPGPRFGFFGNDNN